MSVVPIGNHGSLSFMLGISTCCGYENPVEPVLHMMPTQTLSFLDGDIWRLFRFREAILDWEGRLQRVAGWCEAIAEGQVKFIL